MIQPGPPLRAAPNPETLPAPAKRRFGGTMLLAALAAALVAIPFTLLAVAVRVSYRPLQRLDLDLARACYRVVRPRPGLVHALDLIATAGAPTTWRVLAALIGIGLWWRGRRLLAVWLGVTMLTGGLLGVGLKALVARARPSLGPPVAAVGGYSFPSGHALNSMLFFAALIVLAHPGLRGARRAGLWAGSALVVLAIGLDRLGLGVHYASDVLGGWIIAVATVLATTAGFDLWRHQQGLPPASAARGLEPEREPAGAVRRARASARARAWAAPLNRIGLGLLLRWTALAALLIGTGLLITRVAEHAWPLTAEDGVNRWLAARRTPTGNTLTELASHLGGTLPIIALCAIAAALLRLALHRWRESLFLVAVTVGATVVFLLTAQVVDRHRPGVPHLDAAPPTSSFPSGHAGASTALYVGLALIAHRRIRRRWLRRLLVAVLATLPLLVGLARLYRGMHHPSDVLAGYLNATLILLLTDRLFGSAALPDDRPVRPAARSG